MFCFVVVSSFLSSPFSLLFSNLLRGANTFRHDLFSITNGFFLHERTQMFLRYVFYIFTCNHVSNLSNNNLYTYGVRI